MILPNGTQEECTEDLESKGITQKWLFPE